MGARSAIVESEDVVWTGRPWMEGGGAYGRWRVVLPSKGRWFAGCFEFDQVGDPVSITWFGLTAAPRSLHRNALVMKYKSRSL